MLTIPRWKIILVFIVAICGILYTAPNLVGEQSRQWLQSTLPSWMPTKTVNLGLDLRGGAHLLYEVDMRAVFDERADLLLQDLRSEARKAKIGYSRISTIQNGVRIILRDEAQMPALRDVFREIDPMLNVLVGEDGRTAEMTWADDNIAEIQDQTIAQSIEIIRRRVDEMGTTEPSIARQGERRILLQVPGANAEDLKRLVGTTAKLGFHLVSDGRQGNIRESGGSKRLPYADDPNRRLDIARRALITGDMLDDSQPAFSQGQPVVTFRLDSVGSRRFCDVTRNNINRPFAIVLDNEIVSAPTIRSAICGGSGEISGGFTVAEANDLALLLRAGALPAPLTVVEERTVGPSLGADSVEAGKIASMIGLLLVMVFMGLSYGLFGMMANVALIVNMSLIFAILSGLQATLTLPGIAGIVLTVGMAVDANVLIFERIKEEFRAGRSLLSAVDSGYSRAMATIIDSNLTTLIAALILFSFGTGPVKGFAVTLGIGIVTSFFSAIMITRLMVVFWLRKYKPSELSI